MSNYLRYCSLLWLLLAFSFIKTAQAQSIISKLKANSQTTPFAKALQKTQVAERLKSSGDSFTLFVPEKAAFSKLSENQKHNSKILLNHIITGMATRRSLKAMDKVTVLSGKKISVKVSDENGISVSSCKVARHNMMADNGMIYVIDGVIK